VKITLGQEESLNKEADYALYFINTQTHTGNEKMNKTNKNENLWIIK
jgi:hypothetical protein